MPKPGDIVTANFAGATGVKRRPMVVLSSDVYHANRPDLVLGVLTTQLSAATTPTDYILQDYAAAGLRKASAFRAYFGMATPSDVQVVGQVSDRDWKGIQLCVSRTFGLPSPT